MSDGECPGEGRCHGPMSWCNRCGDVGAVCTVDISKGERCDSHVCPTCHQVAHIFDGECEPCREAGETEDLRKDWEFYSAKTERIRAELARRGVLVEVPR